MHVEEAQLEVRTVMMGGFPGQLVSGLLWLLSAGLSTWVSPKAGIVALLLSGLFIYPGALLVLKLLRRPTSLGAGNPFGQLAMQIAFTIPINLPLVGAATLHRPGWFYPACMIVVGAHYLPFWFLYGVREFIVLAFAMVAGGLALGLYVHAPYATGGWLTGALLLVFAILAARFFAPRPLR
jgi:hypothetical protein